MQKVAHRCAAKHPQCGGGEPASGVILGRAPKQEYHRTTRVGKSSQIQACPAAGEVKGRTIIDQGEIVKPGVGGQIGCSEKGGSDSFHIGSK